MVSGGFEATITLGDHHRVVDGRSDCTDDARGAAEGAPGRQLNPLEPVRGPADHQTLQVTDEIGGQLSLPFTDGLSPSQIGAIIRDAGEDAGRCERLKPLDVTRLAPPFRACDSTRPIRM